MAALFSLPLHMQPPESEAALGSYESTAPQLSCVLKGSDAQHIISSLLSLHLARHKAIILKGFLPVLSLILALDWLVIKLHSLPRYYQDSLYFHSFHLLDQSRGKHIKRMLLEQIRNLTDLNSPGFISS